MKKLRIVVLVLCMILPLFAFVNSYRMTSPVRVSPDYAVRKFQAGTGKPILSELPPEEQYAYLEEAGVNLSGYFNWENGEDFIIETIRQAETYPIVVGMAYSNPGTVTFCQEVRDAVNRYYGRERFLSLLPEEELVSLLGGYGVEFPEENAEEYLSHARLVVLIAEMHDVCYPVRDSRLNDFGKQVYAAVTAYYENSPAALDALRYLRQDTNFYYSHPVY